MDIIETDIGASVPLSVEPAWDFVSSVPPPHAPVVETPDCMYRAEAKVRFSEIARSANRDALPRIGRVWHSVQALGATRSESGEMQGGFTDELNIAVRGCAHILKYSMPEPMKAAALVTLAEIQMALDKYFRTHPKERITTFFPGVKSN